MDWSSDVCSSDLIVDAACAKIQGFRASRIDNFVNCGPSSTILSKPRPLSSPQEKRTARTGLPGQPLRTVMAGRRAGDRKSVGEGTSVSVRVDLGGRRIIEKKISTIHSDK